MCVLIYGVIAIGGYTRLTESGLSIVAWEPLSGVIPPLTKLQWLNEFERYQQFPEFKLINQTMNIEGFKRIFWIEYAHRLAARLVAVWFLLPFVFFLWQRYLLPRFTLRLAVVFALGGVQGLVGWYMVASGLSENPAVSQYRLAAHLSLACVLYGYILWLAAGLLMPATSSDEGTRQIFQVTTVVSLILLAWMQISGAMMAGTHAGFVFNTFPEMNGKLIPESMFALQPVWRNLFENVITIQFFHRWSAVIVLIAITTLWIQSFRSKQRSLRFFASAILLAGLLQFVFGISTLLSKVQLAFAMIHQSGFIVLLSLLILALRKVTLAQQPSHKFQSQSPN